MDSRKIWLITSDTGSFHFLSGNFTLMNMTVAE